MFTVVLDPSFGIEKGYLQEQLSARNIDTRPFFHPLSSIPAYRGSDQAAIAARQNVVSYKICPYGINLPSALNLTREQVAYVCDTLRSLLDGEGKLAAPQE